MADAKKEPIGRAESMHTESMHTESMHAESMHTESMHAESLHAKSPYTESLHDKQVSCEHICGDGSRAEVTREGSPHAGRLPMESPGAEKPCVLVSACLLGDPCRFDGTAKPASAVQALAARYTLIPVCPECAGGLPTPRPPAEQMGERVCNRAGRDVTEEYRRGAEYALRLAQEHRALFAILKARSPSCGHGQVYDGTFTGTLRAGDGVTAALLLSHGIPVYNEESLEELPPDPKGNP